MMLEIRKELAGLAITQKTLRNFGFLFCAASAVWAGIALWKGDPRWLCPAGAGAAFFIAGLLFPNALRRFYWLWMLLAFTLGWFMTRFILVIAYVAIMTPMGWLLRGLGKDVLDNRIDKSVPTYWKEHDPVSGKEQYKKQF